MAQGQEEEMDTNQDKTGHKATLSLKSSPAKEQAGHRHCTISALGNFFDLTEESSHLRDDPGRRLEENFKISSNCIIFATSENGKHS